MNPSRELDRRPSSWCAATSEDQVASDDVPELAFLNNGTVCFVTMHPFGRGNPDFQATFAWDEDTCLERSGHLPYKACHGIGQIGEPSAGHRGGFSRGPHVRPRTCAACGPCSGRNCCVSW